MGARGFLSLSLFIFMRLLFLLSQLHLILPLSSPFVQPPLCHHDERSALLQFKKENFFIVYYSYPPCQKLASTWAVEGDKSDCCLWYGVECDEATGHVIGLDLSYSCLYGSINSSSSLFRLVHLQSLNLAYNDFTYSQIPFAIGNLSRLTHLNLSHSEFSGQIPSGVSHLSKLSSLDLSSFYGGGLYTGSDLRSFVQNFTSLEELLLSRVNISSVVPETLANLSSLKTLDLGSCGLLGEFPTRIFQLPNLRDLSIFGNENLSGQLPEFHSNTSLEVLKLYGTGFYGKLPISIGNLRSLRVLDFQNCHFFGSIPHSLSNLTQLTYLSFSELPGEFPTILFQLANLRYLYIDGNGNGNGNLTSQLPEFHSNTSLEVLDLAGTGLYGKLPTSIGNLRSLRDLYLQNCHFSGSIPHLLSNLTQLTYLDLSSNNLTGLIPSSLPSNMTHLTHLHLFGNNLEGTIPSSFSELKSIETLDFDENNLSGMQDFDMFLNFKNLTWLFLSSNNLTLLTKANSNDTLSQFESLSLGSCNLRKFPDFLRNQNILRFLNLSDNNLQGLVPKWFYNVSIESLEFINLSDNFLVGFEQSPMVLPWSKLSSLDLSNNTLQGSLPIPPPSTRIYRVQRNFIREMSPLLICNLSSLEVLDLSYNKLSGMLPPCLGNFSSLLSVLQLRSNNFHGTIPKTWSKGNNLKMIDFSENQLQGQLPRSMANCTMLEYLHVGNNQINDTFPFWLGNLSQLKVLVLRHNAFHGAIKSPEINYTFLGLHIIDLSQNSFSGNLSAEYFLHWNAMKVADANQLIYMELSIIGTNGDIDDTVLCAVTVTNKGINLEYHKIQDVFTVIDFSSNKFEGEIPELLGSLKGLHSLNLSNNALTGYIPPSLGNLTNIESMDLSKNKLFGEIPPQLTQLFFLAYFNVSNNNLTGLIPHGNQFDTFKNSSFGGNSGLCGSQVSKKCGDFEYAPASPLEENQISESPFEFGWKVVAIGYGCGFMIGVVMGQIVIARKYDWFVKIFGRM